VHGTTTAPRGADQLQAKRGRDARPHADLTVGEEQQDRLSAMPQSTIVKSVALVGWSPTTPSAP
jgi:hypothetical protein